MEKRDVIKKVAQVYQYLNSSLDDVLIGQKNVKKILTAALLCDTNSRILLTGNTGMGKTSIARFLASSFSSKRISITSDMIPTDIQSQLLDESSMDFLYVDEFNRASGKVQTVFNELLEENQMTINGQKHSLSDFYLIATQNIDDITGVFNVPQAIYDRFDVSIYFDELSEDEKRKALFSGFKPSKESNINKRNLIFTSLAVDWFKISDKDVSLLMKVFNLIDGMTIDDQTLFSGSNIRAHKYAIRLVKLIALANDRDYILPCDICDFINYIYMHRINQNVAKIGDSEVEELFANTKESILSLKRGRF